MNGGQSTFGGGFATLNVPPGHLHEVMPTATTRHTCRVGGYDANQPLLAEFCSLLLRPFRSSTALLAASMPLHLLLLPPCSCGTRSGGCHCC